MEEVGGSPPEVQKFFAAPAGAAKARKDNPNSLSNPLQIQSVLWYKERGPPHLDNRIFRTASTSLPGP